MSFTGLAVAAIVALALWRTRLDLPALLVVVMLTGIWRATIWQAQRHQLTSLIGQSVTLQGAVADDPSVGDKRQVTFKLGDLRLVDPDTDRTIQRLPDTITVYSYPMQLQREYRLQVSGKVKAGFGTAAASISYPKITPLSRQQSWLEQTRQRFFAGMRTALPEPISSFGLGLLVGIRALIPKTMQAELALVGLSHLVAVSGYNLTILVRAVERGVGRWGKGIALITSLWLIGGFLLVTGASASIVRASLVSVLSLLATFYGRKFNPLVLILVTAALTAAWDPVYLTDLGWLLSYLAFYGVLMLSPAIEARLGHPKLLVVRLFIESTAAQIMTLPLILFMFGDLSIVAPITNLIILPLVPLAMAVSFLAGVAGIIMPAFAGWLAWPAMLVLGFIVKLIDAFAALPWAGTQATLSLPAMLAAYAVIIALNIAFIISNHRLNTSNQPGPRLT
ncbi:MAG TPA: ComEC/Rec2 family competence protein, partial [Candidatus Saccharimonadia bacterium]